MPRQFKVTVNGREYDVSVLEVTATHPTTTPVPVTSFAGPATHAGSIAPPPPAPPAAAPAVPNTGDVLAAMGGVVAELPVKAGQSVAAGDTLIVLEAMKMKTPLTAPRGGQIGRLLVAPGDAVEAGQLLLTIV